MDRIMRPARLLGVICVLPIVVTGCRTIVPTKPAAMPGAPKGPEANAQPARNGDNPGSIVKTDFHRKVTADQSFNVHIELGRQMFRDQRYESALGEFKKALEACAHASGRRISSHRAEQISLSQRKIGDALLKLGKFAEAEDRYKQAAKLTPEDPRVWNNLGYCYYVQSRWADSERCLRRAQQLDPDSPLVNTNLGFAVAADGRTADGLALLSHSNGKAVGHANLGFLLARQKRDVEAREEYRQALELEPQLTKAREALARLENPGTSPPLVNATSTGATRAPGFHNEPMKVVATPGPSAADSQADHAIAAVMPASAPVASSPLLAPNVAAPTAANAAQPLSPPGGADRELRPTSHETAPTVPSQPPSNLPVPAPAPIQVPPAMEMSPPLSAPTGSGASTLRAPSSASSPSASTSRQPQRSAFRPAPIAPETDHEVLLTGHDPAGESLTSAAVASTETPSIPMPVPVATTHSRMSPVSAIPMPIPPPGRPAKATSASGTSIPMPIPVSRHLARPTTERKINATSAPAVDMAIRPVATQND